MDRHNVKNYKWKIKIIVILSEGRITFFPSSDPIKCEKGTTGLINYVFMLR